MIQDHSFRGIPYKISCTDHSPSHPSWYSFHDECEVRNRCWTITPGDVILDVGAAYGSYTLTALAQGAEFVWAWAPQGLPGEKSEAETLRESLELNGWSDKCRVFEAGVYRCNGYLDTETQGFFLQRPLNPSKDLIQVHTLDAWMDTYGPKRVDWMKLDVEGAEVDVLKGAEKLIARFRPMIHVENHIFKRSSIVDEIRRILVQRMGYTEIFTIQYRDHNLSHSLYFPDNRPFKDYNFP